MRQIIFRISILLLLTVMLRPVQASNEENLENRIKGWISAVNEGNFDLCLRYVAPAKFTGHRGLTKMMIGGGEELLLFSGEHLLPLSEYRINKIEFSNNGYESKVTIDAKIIYQREPLYIKKEGATDEYDMLVYPAIITQRWILLKGKWYIKSIIRLQYLGS
ncbi:MAG: hypothetical protein HKO68_21110 [Desulfobacterales bacterium]|nr:hypothetical protein [Deltaproteobacteria bacterium]NNL78838.1 hypothetical protein [Desulfobacterales bacterium]